MSYRLSVTNLGWLDLTYNRKGETTGLISLTNTFFQILDIQTSRIAPDAYLLRRSVNLLITLDAGYYSLMGLNDKMENRPLSYNPYKYLSEARKRSRCVHASLSLSRGSNRIYPQRILSPGILRQSTRDSF